MKERKTSTRARDKYHFGDHLETIRQMYKHRGDPRAVLAALEIEQTPQAIAALRSWKASKGIQTVSVFYWGEHPQEAIAMYNSGKSLKQCVVAFGHREKDDEFFRRWLHKMGVPLRGFGRRGELHGSWRGGEKMSKGYMMVQHPNGAFDKNNRRVYILKHRLVMQEHLGRELAPEEVVHHKNGDILDNRIENLEIFVNNAEHLRTTLKGQVPKWTPDGWKRILNQKKKKAPRRQQPDL